MASSGPKLHTAFTSKCRGQRDVAPVVGAAASCVEAFVRGVGVSVRPRLVSSENVFDERDQLRLDPLGFDEHREVPRR